MVEQYFSQIYLEYENPSLKSFVLGRAYDGVQLINNTIDQCNKEWLYEEQLKEKPQKRLLLKKYLLFRKYELNFLMGYICVGVPKYDSFIYAVEGFRNISKDLFDMHIPDMNNKMEIAGYAGSEENLQLAVYFVNSIGEAYSKIAEDASLIGKMGRHGVKITDNVLLDCARKAVFYLETTLKWNQRLEDREVYYRNLGCAYERMDRLEKQVGLHADKIISNYKNAFLLVISKKTKKRSGFKKYIIRYYHIMSAI